MEMKFWLSAPLITPILIFKIYLIPQKGLLLSVPLIGNFSFLFLHIYIDYSSVLQKAIFILFSIFNIASGSLTGMAIDGSTYSCLLISMIIPLRFNIALTSDEFGSNFSFDSLTFLLFIFSVLTYIVWSYPASSLGNSNNIYIMVSINSSFF